MPLLRLPLPLLSITRGDSERVIRSALPLSLPANPKVHATALRTTRCTHPSPIEVRRCTAVMGPQGRLVQHKSRGFNAGARMCKPVCMPSEDQLPSWCVFSTALLHCGGIFLRMSKQRTMFERLSVLWKQSRACEGEEWCKNSEVKKGCKMQP